MTQRGEEPVLRKASNERQQELDASLLWGKKKRITSGRKLMRSLQRGVCGGQLHLLKTQDEGSCLQGGKQSRTRQTHRGGGRRKRGEGGRRLEGGEVRLG